jgi:hypothetical protein
MRRIKAFLALVAVMATMLVAFAGPAMADDDRFFAPFNRCDEFLFNCGFPFEGGIFFDVNQQIGDTGAVTLNTTVG